VQDLLSGTLIGMTLDPYIIVQAWISFVRAFVFSFIQSTGQTWHAKKNTEEKYYLLKLFLSFGGIDAAVEYLFISFCCTILEYICHLQITLFLPLPFQRRDKKDAFFAGDMPQAVDV
ncbi:hypothetical protein ACJX0J_021413, partial [Zea mays]